LKVHHGKLVKEWLSEHLDHIQVFYFPSYAPELNPQEYLNNILKQNIHSGIAPKCKKQIYEKANQFLNSVPPSKVRMLFNHPKLAYQIN
jgi:transposase